MTLSELRLTLKKAGYALNLRSMNFNGNVRRCATLRRVVDGAELPSVFFGEAHRREWLPLLDLLTAHRAEVVALQREEGITGIAR